MEDHFVMSMEMLWILQNAKYYNKTYGLRRQERSQDKLLIYMHTHLEMDEKIVFPLKDASILSSLFFSSLVEQNYHVEISDLTWSGTEYKVGRTSWL